METEVGTDNNWNGTTMSTAMDDLSLLLVLNFQEQLFKELETTQSLMDFS
jgi:hypothetical protein